MFLLFLFLFFILLILSLYLFLKLMSIRARDQTFAKKSPGLAGLSVQSRAGASHLDDIKYAPMYANVIVASCINEVCLCLVARVDARCHGGAERAQRIMIQFWSCTYVGSVVFAITFANGVSHTWTESFDSFAI